MTTKLLRGPELTLIALLTYYAACMREVQVLHPSPPCQLPVLAPFPELLSTRKCTDEHTVCMSDRDAAAVYAWATDALRRLNKADACLASR